MEIKKEVKVVQYQVVMQCDVCKEGEMFAEGTALTSYPPQYPHTCTTCGNKANYGKTYPRLEQGVKYV